ncbi:MAG: sodium:alanine symporter family protein [Tissierellia bacterium]|nr:sodium:alanine symporter family protein [Tissierellia bacterium]
MNFIENLVSLVNGILWDYILVIALVGTGIFLSFILGFPQIKRFGQAAKKVFGGIFKKEEIDTPHD